MLNKVCVVLFVFIIGCCPLKNADFLNLTEQNRIVSNETCDSIITSIDDSLKQDNLSQDARQGYLDLRERLVWMQKSSKTIDDYVKLNTMDAKLLAELLNNKWRK